MADGNKPTPPVIVKRNFNVRFSVDQRASMGGQLADIEGTIERVEKEKSDLNTTLNARLKALRAQGREISLALRTGEGEITVDCVWRDDPNRPFRHLWRLDIFEVCASEPLERGGRGTQPKLSDLTTPSPAAAPTGNAPAAGSDPGADVIEVKFGAPPPPCAVPVEGNPGGICGADGDRVACEGLCPMHHAQLDPQQRGALLDAIADRRRRARLDQAASRVAAQVAAATIPAEEEERLRARRVTAALAIKCETCGSEPTIGCIEDGKPREQLHDARLAAARIEEEPAPAPAPAPPPAAPPVEAPADAVAPAGDYANMELPTTFERGEPSAVLRDAPPAPLALVPSPEADGPPPFGDEEPAATPASATGAIGPYTRFNPDRWPLCPSCGVDELHSSKVPPAIDCIVGCFACGWRPTEAEVTGVRSTMAARITGAAARAVGEDDPPAPPPPVVAPQRSCIRFDNGDEIDTTGLPNPGDLVRTGPCKHRDSDEPCIICTRAAVNAARGLPSEAQLAREMASAAPPAISPPPPPRAPEPAPAPPAAPPAEPPADAAAPAPTTTTTPGEAPAPAAGAAPAKCPSVRVDVTPAQAEARQITCANPGCGRKINIRPKLEGGVWKATIATHNRGDAS